MTAPEGERAAATPPDTATAWGSDVVADMLATLGPEYIALNPGASYRGLHDSLVNHLGERGPRMLVCLHEEHAVAIAHGYAKVAGRPMAVALHSNVGLMHATMAIYNAWCDRAPVFILGATGPVDAARRRPWIDWIHTSQDQAALVRPFVKWDNQPGSVPAALEAMLRAWQIAARPPYGPTYVCLDVALQEDPCAVPDALPDPRRFAPGAAPVPPPAALDDAAAWLRDARRPVVLAGRVSRDPGDWQRRVELAERLGAAVITEQKVGAAFPTAHPLLVDGPWFRQTPAMRTVLEKADVVLGLDWIDLGGLLRQAWPDGRPRPRVISASLDAQSINGWSMNHQQLAPVDLPLHGTPDDVVAALLERLPHDRRAAAFAPVARTETPAAPPGVLDHAALGDALDAAFASREVSYLRLPLKWPGDRCRFAGPLDFIGADGGGGIGSGPGMAVGGALALRGSGRLPVAVLGDGDLLMGGTALWTAASHAIPLLIVVANNRGYYNDVAHQELVARQRSRPVENKWVGQRIDCPPVDIPGFARSQGFESGPTVREPAALEGALRDAAERVAAGRCVLVDVAVQTEL